MPIKLDYTVSRRQFKVALGLASPVRRALLVPAAREAGMARFFSKPYDLTWCAEPRAYEPVADLLPRPVRVMHRARFSAEMSRDAPVERVEGCFGAGSDIEDGIGVIGGDGEGEQVRADDVVHVDVVASLHPIAPDVGLLPR